MNPDALAARLAAAGVRVERDVPVADLTTYHVGGPIAILARVGSAAELAALASAVAGELDDEPGDDSRPRVLVVGRGSNLLVADAGFPGLGLVLDREFETVDVHADATSVRAGAAVALPVLARRAAAAGRTGLEFYVGIPGTVGGAVRMNAGGHGRETADVLVGAEVADLAAGGGSVLRPLAALGFGYRHSALAPTEVVTGAIFRVVEGDADAAEAEVAAIVRWRREHQPGGSNAGSVFANPPGDSAGRLVDSLGLKGLRVGGAVVSPKHANFFQAEAGATADDVRRLVAEVRRRVLDATGIALVPELRMVGFASNLDGSLDDGLDGESATR
ncbi:MAG TPA: UDP-N-acetylmuramate dehydrogenase [Acidimicrobiia bacterium]